MRIALLAVLVAGCVAVPGPSGPPPQILPSELSKDVGIPARDQSAALTLRMLQGQTKSTMASGFGLHAAAGMLVQGAQGDTLTELQSALFGGMKPEQVAAFHRKSHDTYAPLMSSGRFAMANGVWTNPQIPIAPKYIEGLRKHFSAEARSISFPQPGLSDINGWVNDKTRGRIPKLFDDLSRDTLLVLVNALYFKDKWEEPFKRSATRSEPFFVEPGRSLPTDMMNQVGEYRYRESKTAQSVVLPYETGMQMVVVVPRDGQTLQALLKDPTTVAWITAQEHRNRAGSIALPKWKSESSFDLREMMLGWGIKDVFNPERSNLRGITNKPAWVTKAIQKTFIEVDEEGTEAAAATGIGVETTAAPMEPEKPFVFRADRPFLYTIIDPNGIVLFGGVVRNPSG